MKKFSLLLLMLLVGIGSTWAADEAIDRSGWTITAFAGTTNTSAEGPIGNMIDGDNTTFFHSDWQGYVTDQSGNNGLQGFQIEMASSETLTKITYQTRANGAGIPTSFRIYVSDSPLVDFSTMTNDTHDAALSTETLGTATLTGTFTSGNGLKTATFDTPVTGKYILFISDVSGQYLMCAEFNAYRQVSSITYTVSGGSVVYDGTTYADGETITLSDNIDESKLSAVATTEGYDYFAVVSGTTINVVSYKQYAKAGQAYLMKNVNAKAYLNTETLVSSNVSLQDDGTPVYFTHNNDGSWYINTASDNTGNYIVTDGWWNCRATTSACAWTIEEGDTEGQYYFKCSTGYLEPNDAASNVALWTDHAKTRSNVLWTIETYSLETYETILSEAIASAKAQIGTNPGYYKEADVTALTDAAETALADESRTIATLKTAQTTLSEGMAALSPIMPEEGKTYQIVSALAAFETQQSVKKAMYDNSGTLSWKTISSTDRTMFWTLAPVDGGYAMVNVSTGNYAGVQATQSSAYPTTSDATVATLTFLGSGQFNIKTTGSDYAMHTGGHSSGAGVSGNVVAWDGAANSGSAWYIVEATAPTVANITYNVYDTDGTTLLWTKTYEGAIGAAYPTPEANYMVIFSGVPTGTVTGDDEVTLTYTTRYDIAKSIDENTKYYALDIHGNEAKYPLYSDGYNVRVEYTAYKNAPDYTNGAVKSDTYAWAFVGDAFNGIKLYNKGSNKYAIHASDADEKITFGDADAATTFEICATTGTGVINGAFALKGVGYTYYFNQRDTYVQAWTAADGGSALRAYAINTTADASLDVTIGSSSYTAYDMYYSTLVIPFYSTIPDGVNVYTVTADVDGNITLEEVSGWIEPFTAYLIKGTNAEKYTFSNSSAGTATADVTTGSLTGVLAEGGKSISSGYVLATNKTTGSQAFRKLETTITLGKNKCYLTLPESARGNAEIYLPGMDEPTSVSEILGESQKNGKYFQNGKIVIVNNGVKYNVAGQRIVK